MSTDNQPITPPEPPPMYQPPQPPHRPQEKSPALATVLSIVPGMGNIYNGLYARGIAFFFIWVTILTTLVDSRADDAQIAFLVLSMVFVWVFNLIDAYRHAVLINNGYRSDLGKKQAPPEVAAGGLLMPGLALIGLGGLAAANRYFEFDLSELFTHWPIFILGLGAMLVVTAMRQKARQEEAVGDDASVDL